MNFTTREPQMIATPLPARSPAFDPPRVPAWVTNLGLTLLIIALWPLGTILQEQSNPYYFDILIKTGISIILAVSLNLINGITGQFSLGHAGFMAVGGYVAGSAFKYYAQVIESAGIPAWKFLGMQIDVSALATHGTFLAVLVAGGFAAAIAGLVVGVPALRLRGDYLAVATLGFGEIIRVVINKTNAIGPFEIGGAAGLKDIPIIPLQTYFFWTYGCVLVCVVAIWRLTYSAHGRAFVAVREDETAAAAMGVNTTFFKVAAFVIGAFFAGVAGGLFAMWNGLLDPKGFGFMKSIDVVVMVVLGGSGSITGSILAAAVLTYLPELLREPPSLWPWVWILAIVSAAVSILAGWARKPVAGLMRGVLLPAIALISCEIVITYAPEWIGPVRVWPWGWLAVLILTAAVTAIAWWVRRPLRSLAVLFIAMLVWELGRAVSVLLHVNLADYRMVIYSILLILMMLVRPEGLLGRHELWWTRRRLAPGATADPQATLPPASTPASS